MRRLMVRDSAATAFVVPGVSWAILGVIDLFGIKGTVSDLVQVVVEVATIVVTVRALVVHVEDGDEQTRAASGRAALVCVKCVATAFLLFGLYTIVSGRIIAAQGPLELVLAAILLSYGISFLLLMGRQDAYLED